LWSTRGPKFWTAWLSVHRRLRVVAKFSKEDAKSNQLRRRLLRHSGRRCCDIALLDGPPEDRRSRGVDHQASDAACCDWVVRKAGVTEGGDEIATEAQVADKLQLMCSHKVDGEHGKVTKVKESSIAILIRGPSFAEPAHLPRLRAASSRAKDGGDKVLGQARAPPASPLRCAGASARLAAGTGCVPPSVAQRVRAPRHRREECK
jgi:hypothetical protein